MVVLLWDYGSVTKVTNLKLHRLPMFNVSATIRNTLRTQWFNVDNVAQIVQYNQVDGWSDTV